MKILQLHSDYIEYTPIKKEVAEAEDSNGQRQRLEEVVVLFTAIEEGDSEETAKEAIKSVKSFLEKIKENRVLIYPYAHLSSQLARPHTALKIIVSMEQYAKQSNINVFRAPFGWNKQFSIAVKGHPLAEQARTFKQKDGDEVEPVSEALQAEEQLHSDWFIMNLHGELIPLAQFNFTDQSNLQKFADYEIAKTRVTAQVPPHVSLMKRLELADNEPGSDPGNLRFYPKGRLIKSLLEQFVTERVIAYGGMEVETPIMYDIEHPSLASYLNRFPARQYLIPSDDRNFFLRFSACFGQFLMTHDTQISYRQLPFRIYELTKYSFRREKSGELTGLRRLRAFTMPDVHAMCKDIDQAMDEAVVRFQLSLDILEEGLELGRDDCELAIRFTRGFYDDHKEFIVSLVQRFDRPALIEMWPEKFFYFTLKWELNFVDNLDKASALSTDQIDVENAERYDITYVDEKGKKRYPIILHCSPSGAIERDIYALLEQAYKDLKNKKIPKFPLWLAPTQIRLIPISQKYLQDCRRLAETITHDQIRVDIDDRELTVSNKIRHAEREWIPYIICYGEKEVNSQKLAIRRRELGSIESMTIQQLVQEIQKQVDGKPYKQLPLPLLVSQRPIFVG